MTTNLYIKALEIGYESGDDGISFNDILTKLKSLKYSLDEGLFRSWFYRNFDHKERYRVINNPGAGVSPVNDSKNFRLSSESLFQYIEYVELKEARINSISAKRHSYLAIGISLISVILPLILFFANGTQKVSIEGFSKEIEYVILDNNREVLNTNKLLQKVLVSQDSLLSKVENIVLSNNDEKVLIIERLKEINSNLDFILYKVKAVKK
ncbi:hypothetical protein [Tenacibaculum aiptasiae]|uniref:hypothetical protein n=1 Tax=Tenacibaculum aiptasiae TaxID=426481 RepID=UPI003B5A42C1